MKTFVLVLTALVLIMLSSYAQPSADTDSTKALEELGQRMTTFYQSPTPEFFAQCQRDADRLESAMAEKTKGGDVLLAVSFARISQKHRWPIDGKGNVAKRAREILEGKSEFARYVNDDAAVDARKLDIWWASFFATGDTVYLGKLLRYAGEPLPKDSVDRMLAIAAATWSFRANCRQHKAVRDFAEAQLAVETRPEKKAFLTECINAAQR
ncbi:MAG: hypothetical protein JXR37_04325 [Kiritimatiellae bacterium]|nr:hypothetical protein [Kiritimatiellia bacterium]